MFLILLAAAMAGLLTMAATASTSLVLALVAGPLVGSAAGFGAALILAWGRGSKRESDHDLDQHADEMVETLRALAEQGRAVDVAPAVQTAKSFRAA